MVTKIKDNLIFSSSCIAARFFNFKMNVIENNSISSPELILHKLVPEALVFFFIRRINPFEVKRPQFDNFTFDGRFFFCLSHSGNRQP